MAEKKEAGWLAGWCCSSNGKKEGNEMKGKGRGRGRGKGRWRGAGGELVAKRVCLFCRRRCWAVKRYPNS